MAADSKDVELRIRARDYSQKTLEQVVQNLEDLVKAQDNQLDSAQRGVVSAKALKGAYSEMEVAIAELARRAAKTKTFETQNATLAELAKTLDAARQAQNEFAATLVKGEDLTDKQAARQEALAKAVRLAEGAQRKAADRLSTTTEALAKYGIAADGVVDAQSSIARSMSLATGALDKQGRAILGLDSHLDAHRKSVAAAAAADAAFASQMASVQAALNARAAAAPREQREIDDAAKLGRQIEVERMWIGLLDAEEAETRKLAKAKADLAAFDEAMMNERLRHIKINEDAIASANRERQALRAVADQLALNARGYSATASARNVAPAQQSNVAGGLRDIADPATAAMRNLKNVEQAFADLGRRVAAINGPVRDAKGLLNDLATAQKGALAIAGQVDGYQRQIAALRAARTAYSEARTAVADLVAQMRAGTGGDDIVSKLAKAERDLKNASAAMGAQVVSARALRTELRAAGVATNDLSGTAQRLATAMSSGVAATNAATAAIDKNGVASGKALTAWEKFTGAVAQFNKGERTTLGYMQRMKGEVLGLATAWVGVNAAITGVTEVLNVVRDFTAIEARFNAVFDGDGARAAEEMEYLRNATNRIGVSFRDSALEYSKFITATNEAKWAVGDARFVFEQFAEAAVRTGQSPDQFKGIMLAITQMISKGKISAEELNQQLAERLPGAAAKLANELKVSVADLMKMMETSAVTSRAVIDIANGMMKDNANAMNSAGAEALRAIGRLQTAKDDFAMAFAKGGFTEAYTQFLTKLTALLTSPTGQKLAKDMGTLASYLVEVLGVLAENFESVKNIVIALVGLKIFKWIFDLGKAFGLATGLIKPAADGLGKAADAAAKVAAPVAKATGAMAGLTRGIGFLAKAIPFLGTAWTVFELGTIALDAWRKASERARAEKERLAGGKPTAPAGDPNIPGQTPAASPGKGFDMSAEMIKESKEALAKSGKELQDQLKEARQGNDKAGLAEAKRNATKDLELRRALIVKQVTDEKEKGALLVAVDQQIADARMVEQIKYNNRQGAAVTTRVNKEANLIAEIAREMAGVEAGITNKAAKADPDASFAERLKARTDAVAHEYNKLFGKIAELEKLKPKAAVDEKGVKLSDKLKEFVERRKAVEETAVKTEELQRLEKNLSDTEALKNQLLQEATALREAEFYTAEQLAERVTTINAQMGVGVKAATAALREFATANQAIMEKPAFQILMSRLNTVDAQNQPQKADAQAKLNVEQERLNELLARRTIMLEEIAAKEKLGILNAAAAAQQEKLANDMFKQQIQSQAELILTQIGVMRAAMDPTNAAGLLALDQLAAKIRIVKMENEGVTQSFQSLTQTATEGGLKILAQSFDGIVDVLGKVISGQTTVAQGLKDMARQSALSFVQMMKDAALYLIKLKLIKMLEGSGNPFAMSVAGAMKATMGVKHGGGMAGSPARASRTYGIMAPAAIPKMHTGGVAGLRNDEVMRVLQKNEEVVTRNDPRHVLNGGTQGQQRAQRIVLVDDRARVPEAMASAQGDEVNLQFLRRNKVAVNQLLGS